MAEAHLSLRQEQPEVRPSSFARITALPTKPLNDRAPSGSDRVDQTDQTRIAELEAELRAMRGQAARTRLTLDSATDYAIITMDTDGCVTSWSAGARAIIGYTEAEIVGRSGDVVFTAEDRARW